MRITNEYYSAMQRALCEFYLEEGISIYGDDGSFREKHPMIFGVNWSAKGTRTIAETRDYAEALAHAADICERLNGLELEVDYAAELTLTAEEYGRTVQILLDALGGHYFVTTVKIELCEK